MLDIMGVSADHFGDSAPAKLRGSNRELSLNLDVDLCVFWTSCFSRSGGACASQAGSSRDDTVLPFVAAHCYACHNEKMATSGLNLQAYVDTRTFLLGRDDWDEVLDKLKTGQMPPPPLPRPPAQELKRVTDWLTAEFAREDAALKPDPAHVTARRLNRDEYNLTIRDLLAVDFQPAADFPVDAFAYGFDNNGDVLSVTPTLMEKYLTAASPHRARRHRLPNQRLGENLHRSRTPT